MHHPRRQTHHHHHHHHTSSGDGKYDSLVTSPPPAHYIPKAIPVTSHSHYRHLPRMLPNGQATHWHAPNGRAAHWYAPAPPCTSVCSAPTFTCQVSSGICSTHWGRADSWCCRSRTRCCSSPQRAWVQAGERKRQEEDMVGQTHNTHTHTIEYGTSNTSYKRQTQACIHRFLIVKGLTLVHTRTA